MTRNTVGIFGQAMVVGGILLFATGARASDIVQSALTACPSDKTVIGGVNACGKVWALTSGQAELHGDGTLRVSLHGLVLNDASVGKFNGSPDGVDAVAAALICGGSSAAVVAQTEPVALSSTGNATIDAKLTLPPHCYAPVLVVRERYEGKIGGWLAATGF
jgi:hypothetical protein